MEFSLYFLESTLIFSRFRNFLECHFRFCLTHPGQVNLLRFSLDWLACLLRSCAAQSMKTKPKRLCRGENTPSIPIRVRPAARDLVNLARPRLRQKQTQIFVKHLFWVSCTKSNYPPLIYSVPTRTGEINSDILYIKSSFEAKDYCYQFRRRYLLSLEDICLV